MAGIAFGSFAENEAGAAVGGGVGVAEAPAEGGMGTASV